VNKSFYYEIVAMQQANSIVLHCLQQMQACAMVMAEPYCDVIPHLRKIDGLAARAQALLWWAGPAALLCACLWPLSL